MKKQGGKNKMEAEKRERGKERGTKLGGGGWIRNIPPHFFRLI